MLLPPVLIPGSIRAANGAGQTGQQPEAGQLDTTFNGSGIAIAASAPGFTYGNNSVQQADGRIVVASSNFGGSCQVWRYNIDGSGDTSFGSEGIVTFGPMSGFGGTALAIQPDGKIVLGGAATIGGFGLVRLNTDGSIDPTFAGGLASTSFIEGNLQANAVAIQADGKIIAAGGGFGVVALARYNQDGSIDSTFGTGGRMTFEQMSSYAVSAVVQPDGQILVGVSELSKSVPEDPLGGIDATQSLVARLNSDGSFDTQFGSMGLAPVSIGSGFMISQVLLQSDGRILAAGTALEETGRADFAVARFDQNGLLDATFGTGGMTMTNLDGQDDVGMGAAIQSDGKIVVAGTTIPPQIQAAGQERPSSISFAFPIADVSGDEIGLARYTTGGSLDPSFGLGGVVTTSFKEGAAAFNCLMQSDQRILVTGTGLVSSNENLLLARYSTGLTVPTFTVSINQSSQTVAAGQSATYTVGLQTAPGLVPPTGPIALSASISPAESGITSTFSPASVSDGASSVVKLSVPPSTSVGTYTITVSGTGGGVTDNATSTLIVQGPDFSLALSEPSITAQPGTTVPVTVAINRIGSLSGGVTVQAPQNLTSGIVVKGTGSASTHGSSVNFKLHIARRATAGQILLTFTGKDAAGQTSSATLTLVVQ